MRGARCAVRGIVSTARRPLPWTDLLAALGEVRFEQIRTALEAARLDPLDGDRFLLDAAVGGLLRELVPDDAPPGAVNAYGALLHALYLCWARDWPTVAPTPARLRGALAGPDARALDRRAPPAAVCYVQLPEHLVWAQPAADAPHEPVDGLFVIAEAARLRALAVLGFRPDRAGFTTVAAVCPLPVPAPGARADGSAPFASLLPAGDRADLLSLADERELAALALLAMDAAGG